MVIRRSVIGASTFGNILTTVVHKYCGRQRPCQPPALFFARDSYTFDGTVSPKRRQVMPRVRRVEPGRTAPTSWTAFPSRWQNKHELGRALMHWLPDIIMSRRLGVGSPVTMHAACAGRGHVLYSNKHRWSPLRRWTGPHSRRQITLWGRGGERLTYARAGVDGGDIG